MGRAGGQSAAGEVALGVGGGLAGGGAGVHQQHAPDQQQGCQHEHASHRYFLAILGSDLPSAFLSVWGSSANDVWCVGADNGSGAAIAPRNCDVLSIPKHCYAYRWLVVNAKPYWHVIRL